MKEESTRKLPFPNPYEGCTKDGTGVKLNAIIPEAEHLFIKSLRLEPGTINTTMCLLWHKLVEACKSQGITSYEQSKQYEQFLVNAILLPGGTPTVPNRESVKSDDASGTPNVCKEAPRTAGKLPSSPCHPGIRSRGKKGS